MKTARRFRQLMADLSGGIAEIGRAPEAFATYWVHCADLDCLGEQIVLERLPVGALLKVEDATYKHEPFDGFDPSEALLGNLREFLRHC